MSKKQRTILVTGAAGFIGARTSQELLERGDRVVGVDNLNSYYDVRLKKYRLAGLKKYRNFQFYKIDIEKIGRLESVFKKSRFDGVINLAARAGVRASLEDPWVYMRTNAIGTLNVLVLSHKYKIPHIVTASTSSLYAGQKMPFNENLPVNTPISPYAASKKSSEMLCYTYHFLYGMNVTILRYFTVYGPAGRPDMAPFRFIKWIDEGKPVKVFGDGSQRRDFTYVDDIARGTVKALRLKGFNVINLGNNSPVTLKKFIGLIEKCVGKKAKIKRFPKVKTDMESTWADIRLADKQLNWKPAVNLSEGIKQTVAWYMLNKSTIRGWAL